MTVTFEDYWEDICLATEGNIVKEDNERTAIVMYEELIGQIIVNASRFKNSGITKEEMLLWIEKIEKHLRTDFKDSDEMILQMMQDDMKKLRENIYRAKKITESVYREME